MGATLRVLDARDDADRAEWVRLWGEWSSREVHAHPSYVELFADGVGAPLCATWQSDVGVVLFPFVHRSTAGVGSHDSVGDATDIVSPYGYGGAFAWGAGDMLALAEEFWGAFDEWAVDHRVISAFVRLSLFADTILPFRGEVVAKQENIVCDLGTCEDDLWTSVDRKVRKNVNKAQRMAVTVEVDLDGHRLDDFLRIYENTLHRRDADDGYYFDRSFFERIHANLPGQFAYFHAIHDGVIISTELVLLSADRVYSFLGGTESEAFDLRPNDALKYEIMRWAQRGGLRWFVLGGGYAPDDGIFRYKRGFAPDGSRPFLVGERVFDSSGYDRLVQAHRGDAEYETRDGYFPAYRS